MQSSSSTHGTVRWLHISGLPRPLRAVLVALRFGEDCRTLPQLRDEEWKQALAFCDRSHLTLFLGHCAADRLPIWVAEHLDLCRAANAQRLQRLWTEYQLAANVLDQARLPHLLLKGFLQAPAFVPDRTLRMQYDLDLMLDAANVHPAANALRQHGFDYAETPPPGPMDHLPPLVRKTGWQWHGDYFDPEIPPVVELHYRLWDEGTEAFAAPGIERFWERRVNYDSTGILTPGLTAVDHLGYASLHALRHLLRGSLSPSHVWELAYFLHHYAENSAFWSEWRRQHPGGLRQMEAIPLELARQWFACHVSPAVAEETAALPGDVRAWLGHRAPSPLLASIRPNKEELWLHLALVRRRRERMAVLRRRLLPLSLPGPVEGIFMPEERLAPRMRWRRGIHYAAHLASRAIFHTRVLAGFAWSALCWRIDKRHAP